MIDLDDKHTFSIVEHFADALPGGFFIYRADGDEGFIYVNKAMLRIFGCETQEEFMELTKNSFRTMVHPDDIDEVERSIAEQIKNSVHDLDYVEYRIIRKDGQVRWIVDYGHFVRSRRYGDIFYVFIDDATEKRRLAAEESRKQSVIEGLSRGFNSIYLVNVRDDTMTPYAWNDPISKEMVEAAFHNSITEANYSQFAAEFARRCVSEEDRAKFLEAVGLGNVREQVSLGNGVLHVFRSAREEDGDGEYVQLSVSPVRGSGFLAVLAMKSVTGQMRKAKAEALEKLLIEQERDNAVHANKAKSAFLFNMSHDLKTPINAIAGFAELARRNLGGDQARLSDYLEKIKLSSDLLVELINDVLSMTEIESGNLSISEAPCDLKEQVLLLGDVFRPQISGKDLNYSVSFRTRHDHIMADALNLKRVLSNLLQNAVNFTGGGGDISLSVSEEGPSSGHEGKNEYKFTVSDTGYGMSREFMQRMYAAFEREQNTTKSQVAGTGLGLTITKNLVEAMGGRIEAESEPGKGTTFTLTIPFAPSAEPPERPAEGRNGGRTWIRRQRDKTRRVLLVEDNELNREIALEIVREAGFEAESASDGQEAVEIFSARRENYFDLVLMDIQMPRLNGYDATKAIRSLPRSDAKAIPIFALTANTLENDKLLAYKSGMDKVIEKPVNIECFKDFLAKL